MREQQEGVYGCLGTPLVIEGDYNPLTNEVSFRLGLGAHVAVKKIGTGAHGGVEIVAPPETWAKLLTYHLSPLAGLILTLLEPDIQNNIKVRGYVTGNIGPVGVGVNTPSLTAAP